MSDFVLSLHSMKYVLNILAFIIFSGANEAFSQDQKKAAPSEDVCVQQEEKTFAWRLTPTLGDAYRVPLDTTFTNFYNTDVEDSYTTAFNYLGNLGSPGESRIFSERTTLPEFIFLHGYNRFNVSPGKQTYYNTQIPFTQLAYMTGGSKANAEDRLKATFGGNINKRFGVGASLDYFYTRGYYNWQAVNSLSWQAYASYTGDRYQIHASMNNARFSNQENGGISDVNYILKPETINENLSDPKNIPTNLQQAWNKTNHRDYYVTQRYNLGFERHEYMNEEDSVGIQEFIPVTSFIHTFHLSTDSRRFRINEGGVITKDFFANNFINDTFTNDSISYWSMKNSLGIALNEGFHKYAKFGLAGYVTLENRKYTNMVDSLDLNYIKRSESTNVFWVGGELTKTKGSILTYRADAKFGLSGYNLGDLDINGELQTKIPLFGDSLIVRANGYFRNAEPSYYMNHYFSNHFAWSNNFDKEKRVKVQGELAIPITRTNLKAGVENLTNYLYFNNAGNAAQHSGNIQVLSAALQQNFKFGVFNWNNSVVYQKSSNQVVLPLPDLSVYSQMYLDFRIARVLHTQIGFDCHYFTKYYSPVYQPATQMFHTQSSTEVGNYPLMNVFANMQLKRVRFYVMMYHVNKGLFGSNDYFAAPNYPLNPRVFKFGLSIDFSN